MIDGGPTEHRVLERFRWLRCCFGKHSQIPGGCLQPIDVIVAQSALAFGNHLFGLTGVGHPILQFTKIIECGYVEARLAIRHLEPEMVEFTMGLPQSISASIGNCVAKTS